MFQNISKNNEEEIFDEDVEFNATDKSSNIKQILKKNFTIQNLH